MGEDVYKYLVCYQIDLMSLLTELKRMPRYKTG